MDRLQRAAIRALWDAADDEIDEETQPNLKRALWAMAAEFCKDDASELNVDDDDIAIALAHGVELAEKHGVDL